MQKRIFRAMCIVGLVAALAGCSFFAKNPEPAEDDPSTLSKPEHAVILLFDGVKNADIDTLKACLIYPETLLTADVETAANNALAKAAVKSLFKKLDYTLGDVTANGETATVTVDVTYPDLEPIITSNYNAFAPKIGAALADGTLDMQSTQNEIMWAVAADLIAGKATGTQTETVEVTCSLVDGQWKVAPDQPILNVCTGNALTAFEGLDLTQIMGS